MKATLKAAILACATLLLTNCASIVSKSSWPVTISSNPAGANVTVTNQKGVNIHTATTPTTVTLNSGGGFFKRAEYHLTFTSKGHAPHTVELKARMNGWFVGNLVFGGLIGILIVDPATGAMWKLDDQVNVNLTGSKLASAVGDPMQLRIVDRSQIPAEWEGRLVALN